MTQTVTQPVTQPTQEKDYLDLADRVEAATGPDRELDYAIGYLRGVHTIAPEDWRFIMSGSTADKQIPAFTGSIDTALTLAEPSWWFNTSAPLSPEAYGCSREDQRQPRAGFEMIGPPYSRGGRGATMALATCVAALRAHASRVGDRRGGE